MSRINENLNCLHFNVDPYIRIFGIDDFSELTDGVRQCFRRHPEGSMEDLLLVVPDSVIEFLKLLPRTDALGRALSPLSSVTPSKTSSKSLRGKDLTFV